MIARLLRLWPHAATLNQLTTRYALAGILQGALLVLLIPLLRALLDTPPRPGDAVGWLAAIAALGLAYLATQWWAKSIGYRTANRVMRDLQHDLGRHLRRLPLGWFVGNPAGRLARTVSQSTPSAAGIVSHVWPEMVHAVVTPVTMVVGVFLVDWRMGVAFLVTVPAAVLVVRWSGPVVRDTQAVMDHASAEAAGRAIEFAQAQPVFRATGRALAGFAPMERALDEQRRTFRAALTRHTMPQFAYIAVVQVGFTVVLLVGVWLALGGRLAVADTVALLVLAARFVEPLAQLANLFGTMRVADVALDRVAEVLTAEPLPEPATPQTPALTPVSDLARGAVAGQATEPALGSAPTPVPDTSPSSALAASPAPTPRPSPTPPAVEFYRVDFGYADAPVLRDLSLSMPTGTMTALVGPSGAGKTTVLRLIARFWDVQGGAVRVGGVDVRDTTTQTLLDRIAIVFQDTYLFSGTIEENLRLVAPDATEARLRRAARAARLDEVVDRLPDGWATTVGEGGLSLSGGERQRVAIARALLKDAPIVLLDEVTAALDPENEAAVAAGMAALAARGTTLVVIAHRLSTVEGADQIAVLDAGRLAELGRHDDLLRRGGRYADFWSRRSQAAGWRLGPTAAT